MAVPCAAPFPILARPADGGRHRRITPAIVPVSSPAPVGAVPVAARVARTVDVVARVGSVVSLAALLVLATTVGGLAAGSPDAEVPTVIATFDGGGHH